MSLQTPATCSSCTPLAFGIGIGIDIGMADSRQQKPGEKPATSEIASRKEQSANDEERVSSLVLQGDRADAP